MFALIPAAGSGERFGGDVPKQYALLGGKPMLCRAIAPLIAERRIERVFVVLDPADRRFAAIDWGPERDRVVPLYCGGGARAMSVRNGLVAIGDLVELADWILVHDAARPCLASADVGKLIDAVADDPVGGLLAALLADTLKRGHPDERVHETRVDETIPRDGLWRALTPQMFRYGLLLRGLNSNDPHDTPITDEASAVERLNMRPLLVAGSSANIKVTVPEDLTVAARLLGLA